MLLGVSPRERITRMSAKKLRMAVAGLQTHAGQILRIYKSSDDLEIVALADTPENCTLRQQEYPDWVYYEPRNYERMYDEQKPDVVSVACKPSEKSHCGCCD